MVLGLALAACGGGGGGAGTSVFDPGTGTNPNTPSTLADLAVVADKTSVPNSGAEVVTFTITALTSGNAALTGVETPVTVEVESGAIVTPSAKVTSKDTGKITAVVQITDKTSRTVKLNVSSGSVKKTASFEVVDSVNGSKVADLRLVVDKVTLPNDGTQVAKLSVTSVDAFNSAIGGSPVSLALIDPVAGGSIINAFGKTSTDDTSGVLAADISLVTSKGKTNRSITVQATSGTVVRTISFDVVEAVSIVPKASDLTIGLSKNTVGNAGSETVDVVVTAVDTLRNAVPGIKVTFTVDSNAILVPGNLVTDANGVAKASVLVGADRSNRTVTVTATSDALVRRASFKVTGAKLQAQLLPATLRAGDLGAVEYTLTDVNLSPMVGVAVAVGGSQGAAVACVGSATPSEAVTDSKGKYTYCYKATGSGPTEISAMAGGTSVKSTVQIDATVSDVPAATPIGSATFTASPAVVAVNLVGSSENRVELRLLFRSDKNEPIPNVRARIGLGGNNSGTDGSISSGNDKIIISDATGIAVTSFVAGQRPSPPDQVKVYACFSKTDAVETIAACPTDRLRTVSLTVVEQPVSVTIGTNGLIGTGTNKLTYYQEFTVLVVDSAGKPKSDVQIAPLIDLPSYLKGYYRWDEGLKKWIQVVRQHCLAEDISPGKGFRNGTIEVGEDLNDNNQLDPRQSDVAVTLIGSTRTDSNGLAVIRIEYPQNYGSWTEYSIRVSASGVVSPPAFFGRIASEGDTLQTLKGTSRFTAVPVDVIKAEGDPPFGLSPYGQIANCSSPN
ncbi:hypothetical protein C1O66_01125 [Paucibacter aquatile]|uniref:Big-1 domain-containing protein n=3 Tax=cellular organisms TaxID=131567 RepID=A0A2N8L2V9_9BURK|nr:hypothetical protein C1O66_01125 [Paucibacter aquatile]